MAVEARDSGRIAQRRMPSSTGTPQDPGPRALAVTAVPWQVQPVAWVPTKGWTRPVPPPLPVAAVKVALVVAVAAAAALLSLPAAVVGVRAAWWVLPRFSAAPAAAVGGMRAAAGGAPTEPLSGATRPTAATPGGVGALTGVPNFSVVGAIGSDWTPPAVTARVFHARSGDPAVDEQMDLCTDAAARCIEVEGTQAACDACVSECSDAADVVLASSTLSGDEKADLLTLAREQSDRCEEDM